MGGVNVQNILMGPADLYYSKAGATEPPDSAITPNGVAVPPPTPPWVYVGATSNGVNFEVDTTYTDFDVDQIPMSPGARLTAIAFQVTTELAEITLSNITLALNYIATFAQYEGYATLDYPVPSVATQPDYSALLIDGFAPETPTGAPARRRVIVRKVLSKAKMGLKNDKKTQQGIPVTWDAYYVSDSIVPVHQVDQQF